MSRWTIVLGTLIILAGVFAWFNFFGKNSFPQPLPEQDVFPSKSEVSQVTVIAQNLDTPWGIAFLPDPPTGRAGKNMLVTERPGRVRLINSSGNLQPEPVAILGSVKEIGEGGLLGITLHPNFSTNNYVYLYYTYEESGGSTLNRVVRMVYQNGQLKDEQIIIDKIPGASNHNGGRIKFGSDGYLYITTGDAQNPSKSQDINSLAGKILRVTDEGRATPGNTFNNLVYSYGHRNPQGLAWDNNDQLWATEHGSSTMDEFNKIEAGKNYGWPDIRGDQKKMGMEQPFSHSGDDTWAPSGAAYYKYSNNRYSIFFAGLRGQALYEMEFNSGNSLLRTHFKRQFGRIRDVVLGPDNILYITTSNRDGRGNPDPSDDRVLKVNPEL